MAVELSTSNERDALVTFLDRQRDALIRKASGVGEADAHRAPTASSLSLVGLLRHCAVWEARWFGCIVAGQAQPDGWPGPATRIPDEIFQVDDADTVELWVARYEQAARTSRQIVDGRELDRRCARTDIIDCNLRYVLLHMIEDLERRGVHTLGQALTRSNMALQLHHRAQAL